MPPPSLAELTASAAAADGPSFTPIGQIKFGGVDPLGLRQINFNLMDKVFPDLNNVARHIRAHSSSSLGRRAGQRSSRSAPVRIVLPKAT
jgi:hypothetical protein